MKYIPFGGSEYCEWINLQHRYKWHIKDKRVINAWNDPADIYLNQKANIAQTYEQMCAWAKWSF